MMLYKGLGLRAGSKPMSSYARRAGETIGHYWYIPNVSKTAEFPHVASDVNYWKTFTHTALATAAGDTGSLAGLIDWEAIKDRTRETGGNIHWENPAEIVDVYGQHFRLDTRADQPRYIEVWVEKDALEGVIERSCRKLDVPWLSCRGYVSISTLWEASQRFIAKENEGKESVILHLGDHDPSGIDMTRDMRERMAMFGSAVRIDRIALNMDQVNKYQPPPNPAKKTDSRFKAYTAIYGEKSWELDALDPHVITSLVEDAIANLTDEDLQASLIDQQNGQRRELASAANHWPRVVKFLKKLEARQ
jgi:hypothetical protein